MVFFFFFISQLITSPFKNLAGLQILFWDLPTSHLQKQRRTMRNMALGASSWKSSSSRAGQNLSKMNQPIPSMREMRRTKMKCINNFHFHMLLSCSELWEITKKKERGNIFVLESKATDRELMLGDFLWLLVDKQGFLEKTVSCITDVAWSEQQKETTGAVQVERILMLPVL